MYKTSEKEQNICLQCGTEVYGRIGKRFCSDRCRTRYHNSILRQSRLYRGKIMTILGINYRILENLLAQKKTAVLISDLESMGYRMSVFTGYSKTRYGHTEIRCFDIRFCKGDERIFNLSRLEM